MHHMWFFYTTALSPWVRVTFVNIDLSLLLLLNKTFHSKNIDRKVEWPGPCCWCNLILYCLLYKGFHASHTGLLAAQGCLCWVFPYTAFLTSSFAQFTPFQPLCYLSSIVQYELHSRSKFSCDSLVDACPIIHIICFRRTALKNRFITLGQKKNS